MMLKNELFENSKFDLAGLEKEQHFVPALQPSLPPIVGFNLRNEVRTGRGFSFENGFDEASRGLEVRSGDNDY